MKANRPRGALAAAATGGALLVTVLALAAVSDRQAPTSGDPALAIAKAQCGAGDRGEVVLQGQVPFNERAAGFKGYNCNLTLTAATRTSRGEGLGPLYAMVRDRAGHICGYTSPTYFSGK